MIADLIVEMKANHTDFYEQVAGNALDTLKSMYGDSLSQQDVDRVIQALNDAKTVLPLKRGLCLLGPLAYTVTIAGPEREEGHAPYTYVVNADNPETAWEKVRAEFVEMVESEDVVRVSVVPGVPAANCGYHWNDSRV